jgi:hypothetical protein
MLVVRRRSLVRSCPREWLLVCIVVHTRRSRSAFPPCEVSGDRRRANHHGRVLPGASSGLSFSCRIVLRESSRNDNRCEGCAECVGAVAATVGRSHHQQLAAQYRFARLIEPAPATPDPLSAVRCAISHIAALVALLDFASPHATSAYRSGKPSDDGAPCGGGGSRDSPPVALPPQFG